MEQFNNQDPHSPGQDEVLSNPELGSNLDTTQLGKAQLGTKIPQPMSGGRTDRKVFWIVLMLSLFALTGMVSLVSKGAIAMAAAVPVPFTIQATTLSGRNFHLYPGISQADNSTPVAVNQMDCTIADLVITKPISIPGLGTITVKMSAGNGTPANLTGLTTDVAALGTSSAVFQGLSINTGPDALDLTAPTATLNNPNISSPYLLVNSITLPGLSLSLSFN